MADVRVTFSAEDQATEVARKLLETMRALEREQRNQAQATAAVAKPARDAATAFTSMQRALVGIRNTGGVDAISKRVSILAQGLKSASTQAASLAKLTAAEAQLQKALRTTNLTLEQRITLERTLQQTQAAIAGQGSVSGLAGGAQAALAGLTRLQGVLGALGVAISIAQFTQFTKSLIDSADALNDLSQRTGVSTESLSVLTQVAEKSGASAETVATGFRNLGRQVAALRAGNQDAIETFRALGLSAQDLAGLSLDQIFVKVADAQARFADGAGKVTVATRLFGRAGDELIPTLNELANGGFAAATEKARALGGVISGETARAADEFNDRLADAQTAFGGLMRQLVSGILPSLTEMAQSLTTILQRLQQIRDTLPAWAREVAVSTAAAAAKSAVLSTVLGPVGGVQVGADGAAKKLAALARAQLGLKSATDAASGSFQRFGPTLEQLKAGRPDTRPPLNLTDPAAAKAARQAELSALRQHSKDILAIVQAQLRQREQVEDAAFAANLVGFEAHFQRRLAIAREGTKAEVDAITQEINTLRSTPLAENTTAARTQRESEINSLVEQRRRVEIDGETQVLGLIAQQAAARKAAVAELATLQAQLFRQQGDEIKASQLEIAAAADRFADQLRVQGFGEQLVADLRGAFSTLQTDIAAFADGQRKAQQELNALALDRAAIEQRIATGELSQRDGVLAIAQAERDRLPALRAAAEQMQFFAQRVGDPALLQAARQLQVALAGMGVVIDQAKVSAINLKDALLDAAQSDFAEFLGSGITQAKSGLDALIGLARSLAASFQRIVATVASEALFARIRTALSGRGLSAGASQVGVAAGALGAASTTMIRGAGAVSGAAAALAAAATLMLHAQTINAASAGLQSLPGARFAGGGYVRGPGTGTSDSITARLSAGEYVIRAAAVRALGVQYLDLMNGLRTPRVRSLDSVGIPRFADGGLVVEPRESARAPREDTLHAVLELSPDLVLREITSTRGLTALAKAMGKHPSRFRAALG